MKLAKYLFGLVAAFALALPAQAITRVGTSTASATTITCPTHSIGDFLLIAGVRASATAATVPSPFSVVQTGSVATATAVSLVAGYKIATSTTDTSGTWTNASNLVCHVYHPGAGTTILVGQHASSTSTTATITYPALTLADSTSGNSWIVGLAGASNITQNLAVAPTGMTNESTLVGAANSIAGADTTAGVSSWTSQTAASGAVGHSVSFSMELVQVPFGTAVPNIYQYVSGAANVTSRGLTGNAFTLPLPNISGAGNTIVIDFSFDSALTVSSVTGSVNGTYTVAKTAIPVTGNIGSATYYHANVTAGSANEIITVTLSAATTAFQFQEIEYYGVSTTPLNGSQSTALTTTTSAGSYTPGNNNANGGNIIHTYFVKADRFPNNLTTGIFPGPGFQLVSGNISWVNAADGMPTAVESGTQATSAAINPSITSIAETGDDWNGISTAWALSPGAGTPPSTAVILNGIQHFSTTHYPATGVYPMQVGATGNLRVVSSTDPNLNALTLTDSEGGTWTAAAAGSGFWYRANTTPNPNLIIYIVGGGADASLSFAFSDVANAATTSTLNSSNVSNQTVSGLSSFTATPSPSPTSTNGITIANIGLGQGPGLGVSSPTGPPPAVFDFAGYTGETDSDGLNNADLMAHYVNTVAGAQTWIFQITNVVSNSTSGGWATFVGLAGTTLATGATTNGADVSAGIGTATGGGGGATNTGFFFSANTKGFWPKDAANDWEFYQPLKLASAQ